MRPYCIITQINYNFFLVPKLEKNENREAGPVLKYVLKVEFCFYFAFEKVLKQ